MVFRRRDKRTPHVADDVLEWIYGERGSQRRAARGRSGDQAETASSALEAPQPAPTTEEHAAATVEASDEALVAAELEALAITTEARRQAKIIVKEAEAKAIELLAQVERNRARTERKLAQEKALLEKKRKRLRELLHTALEEVKGRAEGDEGRVHQLSETRENARRGTAARSVDS